MIYFNKFYLRARGVDPNSCTKYITKTNKSGGSRSELGGSRPELGGFNPSNPPVNSNPASKLTHVFSDLLHIGLQWIVESPRFDVLWHQRYFLGLRQKVQNVQGEAFLWIPEVTMLRLILL